MHCDKNKFLEIFAKKGKEMNHLIIVSRVHVLCLSKKK